MNILITYKYDQNEIKKSVSTFTRKYGQLHSIYLFNFIDY